MRTKGWEYQLGLLDFWSPGTPDFVKREAIATVNNALPGIGYICVDKVSLKFTEDFHDKDWSSSCKAEHVQQIQNLLKY